MPIPKNNKKAKKQNNKSNLILITYKRLKNKQEFILNGYKIHYYIL
ncbi:hypothetical protein XIS1_1040004 [Xenorhabdus innexi]|uniref:Uncharacterized protein n=1 Tax=Xenorhabdus innexi TaxID=290109 RepID=A0A1N6MQ85_9GAMM|nr:hypothetical protein XIS1_1040004 [Xenorhabdus innexi]